MSALYWLNDLLVFQLKNVPEAEELLKITDKHVLPGSDEVPQKLKFPFIVVEGMDATGLMFLIAPVCIRLHCNNHLNQKIIPLCIPIQV